MRKILYEMKMREAMKRTKIQGNNTRPQRCKIYKAFKIQLTRDSIKIEKYIKNQHAHLKKLANNLTVINPGIKTHSIAKIRTIIDLTLK